MKKLLLILLCLPLFFGCRSEESKEKITEIKRNQDSFNGFTDQEIIDRFINYMEWYKEGVEFSKQDIQIRKITNYEYSIKYKELVIYDKPQTGWDQDTAKVREWWTRLSTMKFKKDLKNYNLEFLPFTSIY